VREPTTLVKIFAGAPEFQFGNWHRRRDLRLVRARDLLSNVEDHHRLA
jgi:hypothetical protein